MTVFEERRIAARVHHRGFTRALVERALFSPAAFLATATTREGLEALWWQLGTALPVGQVVSSEGLEVELKHGPVPPIVMITFPPPAVAHESYCLCALPAAVLPRGEGLDFPDDPGAPLRFRVFTLDRSVLPDGGTIGWVIEWTGARRRNFDAPRNASLGAFWAAIVEIVLGDRPALASLEHTLGSPRGSEHTVTDAIDQLERADWFSEVGLKPTPGWPAQLHEARVLFSWEQLLGTARECAHEYEPAMNQLKAGLADTPGAYELHMGSIGALTQEMLGRKVWVPPEEAALAKRIALIVQQDLIVCLSALQYPSLMRFEAAAQMLFLYGEGRVPWTWKGSEVNVIF